MQKGGKSKECFLKGKIEERKGQQKEAAPKEKIQSTVLKERVISLNINGENGKLNMDKLKDFVHPAQ